MKKLLAVIILMLFVLCVAMPSFAAVGTEHPKKVIERTWTKTDNRTIDEVHRVVSGMAAAALGPNFLDNDWDSVEAGSWSNLTQDDLNYLRTLTGLSAGVWWYIDLTTRTVSSSPFRIILE